MPASPRKLLLLNTVTGNAVRIVSPVSVLQCHWLEPRLSLKIRTIRTIGQAVSVLELAREVDAYAHPLKKNCTNR
jgi:hypothetical protein